MSNYTFNCNCSARRLGKKYIKMSESSLHSDGEGEAVGDPGGSVEDQSEGVGPSPTAIVDVSQCS